ncbi:SIR2 family protein [Haloimpatiens sp. FM7330]|uniref:SIR2 family NAD-dependent protein deacylase n=1 Tax=Haloimpatiens sp. FM7330 TaxID=3298610 RepID=UPI00362E7D0B
MNFEEIMEFNAPYNQINFDSLVEKIKSKDIVPYIGAGMSMLFEDVYPSWGGFLNTTFNKFADPSKKNKFDSMNCEDKADFLYGEMGKLTFSKHLQKTFSQNHLNKDTCEFVDKSIYLLPVIFEKGLLITTNYDKVIEKVYSLHNLILPVAHPGHFEALNVALRDNELLLYKIHGDINEPIESIILTKKQYELAYNNPQLINALKQIYTSKSMLFLGCSLEKDRPIELLCEVSESGMSNYAIINCKNEDKKNRRLRLENDYYTQAIIYPDEEHECVKIILEQIAKIINPTTYKKIKDGCYDNKNLNMELADEWFINQNKIQIKNLGNRYLPDLNIELSEKNIFDALGRNKEFYKSFINRADKILIALKDLKISSIENNIQGIYIIIKEFSIDTVKNINIEEIIKNLKYISEIVDDEIKSNNKKLKDSFYLNKNSIRDRIYKLNQSQNLIGEYIYYLNSSEIKVLNSPFILLHGEGGIGKSHLLADTIMKRNFEGKKSLLFLGQHFKEDDNPINAILKMLELHCTSDEFLGELNKIAQNDKSRIIIFIDALNEGNGKKIWKEHLAGIIEKIKLYPWIGLALSIRTEYIENLLNDNDSLESNLVRVTHRGFSTVEYDAIKKYFDFYKIPYSDVPFANQEFRNPLFLRLLCEGFKKKKIDLDNISFTDVYKNYLSAMNLKIAEICDYSKHINVVEKVINEMVLYKYNTGAGNNLIPLDKVIEIVVDIEKRYNIKKSLIDELISNGIITQNMSYDNQEYVYVTYEKLEDYLYAKLLIVDLEEIGTEKFYLKYKKLKYRGDILEALAIALSDKGDYELFELFVDEQNNRNIIEAFCSALKWRKSNSVNQKTLDYINNVVLKSEYGFRNLYGALILISTKIGHKFNAECTAENILKYRMPDRDELFIPLFDEFYFEEGSPINRLLDWCLTKKNFDNVLDETIRLAAIMISTFLISSNNKLRDKSTKALVSLLNGRIDILILVLKKFENVDDPYILERLYAVAFGCVVSEKSNSEIEKLAIYVYDKIFKDEYVYLNILLRNYAKNIVEYAKYKVVSDKLKYMDVQPPYKSEMPEVPTDEETSKYEYDYKSSNFKNYFWSQNDILRSMRVEYDRDGSPGGYGDFGRYVFQRYFSQWNGLDYNDLKNIAIKKIFDMGYDVEKHGEYDRNIEGSRFRNNTRERIGKKYQWIALYELAAQVADNYKMEIHKDCYGGTEDAYCKGSFEPDIRNIDPTASIIQANNKDNKVIHNQLYQFPTVTNNEWLSTVSDIPKINDLINIKYNNEDFILLNGWYTWTEEKELGSKQYENPQKDLWIQINSYIVKSKSIDIVVKKLKNKDFMGRWAAEPNENYSLYNKEYYWSDAYSFFKNPYYCGNDLTDFHEFLENSNEKFKVLLPSCKYLTERKGDELEDNNSCSWYKPCMNLFTDLNMKYGKGNSILYDSEGKIICFDSSELLKEDIGFFIDKNAFLQYLQKNNYSVFWTILSEKRIIAERYNYNNNYRQPHISGVYILDENGELKGDINKFEE